MKLIVRAKRVRQGDTFVQSGQKCFVVFTDRNSDGQAIIRFVTDTNKDTHVNTFVVNPELPFELVQK